MPLEALADSSRQRPAGSFDEFSAYPPIADYGFLSDCEVTALVAPSGSVEWMCLPKMDGPSVFGAMLDRDAGWFRFGPDDVNVPSDRRYLPGTMVLETSWDCGEGWLVVRECLVMGPWQHDHPDGSTHIRPPTDYDAEHMLLRTVRCVDGQAQLTLDCVPAFDYGRQHARWRHTERGYTQAVVEPEGLDLTLTLTSDIRLGLEGSSARGRTLLKEGDTRFVALSWGHRDIPLTYSDAYRRPRWTAHHWQHWLAHGRFPDHPWRGYLQRSALTLKGLTFGPTGALVAAATTSLPETPGGERNWDYRYSWIRDSTFALWGLYTLGFEYEANNFFYFIADACGDDPSLQPMYGVGGEKELDERTLDHLTGYEGARPVRIGNGAYRQEQHDVWGSVMDSVYLHTKSRDALPEQVWPFLKRQVQNAVAHWREPDRGIWEVPGEPKHFTSSKVTRWVACDRGVR